MERHLRKEAEINKLIQLPERPVGPVERWKMLPVVRPTAETRTKSGPRSSVPTTPLTQRSTNVQCGSPDAQARIAIKYMKAPKTPGTTIPPTQSKPLGQAAKTPGHVTKTSGQVTKTPGQVTKTPRQTTRTPGQATKTPKSASKKTPGNNAYTPSSCRYIPSRVTTDVEYSTFLLQNEEKENDEYREQLLDVLSHSRGRERQKTVLSFKVGTTPSKQHYYGDSVLGDACTGAVGGESVHRASKTQSISAEKVLDAPTLVDDYYLNNLDWSRTNMLAIGLGAGVYIWNATTGSHQHLTELPCGEEGGYVSSLSWSRNGKFLAVGGSDSVIQLWDIEKCKKLRSLKGHKDRVGALSWNKHTLASGSRDGKILHSDVRRQEPVVGQSLHHTLEVCGLEWSADGSKLASGGDDNLVCVWNNSDLSQPAKVLKGHQAAVKSLSWCPWKPNTLATGGGSSDRCIRFWNTFTGECSGVLDTGSQVSSLAWNKDHQQVISAHGTPHNHMIVWQYPSMQKVSELTGHTDRILQMCLSPRRGRVASAASDETMRIWQCFERLHLDTSQRSYMEESITSLLHSFH